MCGIFFSCSQDSPILPSEYVLGLLKRRGPDSVKVVQRTCQSIKWTDQITPKKPVHTFRLVFVSTVLSLRGNGIIEQPLADDTSGSLLCWNGEAWKLDSDPIAGNDTQAVFNALLSSTAHFSTGQRMEPDERDSRIQAVLRTFGRLSGPFSFVFYDALSQQVFYGRDMIGRRSLLYKSPSPHDFIVSSISDESSFADWTEVEVCGIHIINLYAALPPIEDDHRSAPTTKRTLPFTETILLSNDEHFKTCLSSSRLVEPVTQDTLDDRARNTFPTINREIQPPTFQGLRLDSESVNSLHSRLRNALLLRLQNVYSPSAASSPTGVAILFSGGLDCTLIARLMHDILPVHYPIDLLNVAFENPRIIATEKAALAHNKQDANTASSFYGRCPDRITGLSSHAELLNTCPDRLWRFVSVDVPYSETLKHRSQIVSLIRPHNTEMDFSIACALYFAARGTGEVYDPEEKFLRPYTTPARILISGLGADELFGGYSRHSIAFTHKGHDGILDELELDFRRLGKRNLGRDDRVISHWGKEARYPYLDENLVTWTLERPLHEKCNFGRKSLTNGTLLGNDPMLEPDKYVLRLLAWKLNMPGAAREKKRAIQFGSRTAKMVSGRSKGTQTIETVTV